MAVRPVALVAAIVAALASTCGFLTDDVFPRWLSYVEASVDFRSVAVANGLGDDPAIENMEYAPFVYGGSDYSKVLVYANGNGASKLMLLDPESLEHEVTLNSTDFNRSLASVSNGFMCGTRVVDPVNPTTILPGILTWTDSHSVRAFRVGEAITGFNYAVDPYPTSLGADFREYDSGMTLTANIASRNWDSSGIATYYVQDAEAVNGYSVLASRYGYQGYVASYSVLSDLTNNSILQVFDWVTTTVTGPFPVADQMAWLTDDGPVAYYRGDGRDDRLVRYRWGTGDFATGAQAEEIDSLKFDTDDIAILSFDPSGAWWFIYDRLDGRLYKLRTWWK